MDGIISVRLVIGVSLFFELSVLWKSWKVVVLQSTRLVRVAEQSSVYKSPRDLVRFNVTILGPTALHYSRPNQFGVLSKHWQSMSLQMTSRDA